MRRIMRILAMALALFVGVSAAHAQAIKVDDTVVVISEKAEIRSGEEVVSTMGRGWATRVREVRGAFLGVCHTRPGYLERKHVVLVRVGVGHFSEQLRVNAKDVDAIHGRANCNRALGEFDQAIADYRQVLKLDPEHFAAAGNRGLAWAGKGDFDKAIADQNEAIKLVGNKTGFADEQAIIYANRGQVWEARRDFDKALADYNEAIRVEPRYYIPYQQRAWLWATCTRPRIRDGKKAVESASLAYKLQGWPDSRAFETLAAACAEARDFESAVKWQTKALESTDAKEKVEQRSRLAMYQQRKPYREKPPLEPEAEPKKP